MPKKFLHRYILLIIIFFTGSASLILEVTATRILSVYFGNTIFSISSVVSIILLALSVGYYTGGRLANKKATVSFFYSIIILSGISVLFLYLLKIYLLPYIGYNFSLKYGPLIASMLLFFLPGFFLGMLTPIVAQLQKNRLKEDGIGKIAGDVFFWSTLGSILGSLGSGFVLIPLFGINQIIVGVGVSLLLLGLIGLGYARQDIISRNLLFSILFLIPILYFTILSIKQTPEGIKIVYENDAVYGKILIYDFFSNGRPVRLLKQDYDESSAVYLDSSESIFNYIKYYELYKLTKPVLNNALVLGAGGFSVPETMLQNDNHVQVDVVDIEPDLFSISKRFFNIHDSPRLNNYIEDARRFLHDTQKQYDLIFSDVYHFSIPSHIVTKEYFQLTKEKLKPNSLFIANVIGSLDNTSPSFLRSEIKTFSSVYPNSYFFALNSLRSTDLQNVIFVGYNSIEPLNLSLAKNLDSDFLANAKACLIDINTLDLNNHVILTDNYSPVEFFIAQTIDKKFF